jgi:hypothetical protein
MINRKGRKERGHEKVLCDFFRDDAMGLPGDRDCGG